MEQYFQRVRPEEVNIRSEGILKALEKIDRPQNGTHAFMVLRHGKVAAEAYWAPYAADKKHCLFSVSKSFTCMAVGFAVQEGLLSVDDKIVSFFPERFEARPCENMEKITVKHCLTMTNGFFGDPHNFPYMRPDDVTNQFEYSYHGYKYVEQKLDWTDNFLKTYVPYEPGTEFIYCTQGTYILSVILTKLTGQSVYNYLKPRLFEPLGIKKHSWQEGPEGATVAGWGLDITLEDLSKFAQFMLQKGCWEGKQLLDPKWIEEATSNHIKPGMPGDTENTGFGYQIWLCKYPGAYNGIGAFGQRYIVIPDKDAVITFYSGVDNVTNVMDAIWNDIVPAMEDENLEDNQETNKQLDEKINSLHIQMPKGEETSECANLVSGNKYELSPNYTGFDYLEMTFGKENDKAVFGFKGDRFTVDIGHGKWIDGKTCVKTEDTDTDVTIVYESVSCAGAWISEDTYRLRMCFDETSYINTMDIRFMPHGVKIKHSRNVSFMESTTLTIVGMRIE